MVHYTGSIHRKSTIVVKPIESVVRLDFHNNKYDMYLQILPPIGGEVEF